MGRMRDEYYWGEAKRLFETPRKGDDEPATEVVDHGYVPPGVGPAKPAVQFNLPPRLSHGTTPGAWVMMWAWIPDPTEASENGKGEKAAADQGVGGAATAGGGNG